MPFQMSTGYIEAKYYDTHIGPIQFIGWDKQGRPMEIIAIQTLYVNESIQQIANQMLKPMAIISYQASTQPIIKEVL